MLFKQKDLPNSEELLRSREARVLEWSIIARLMFLFIFLMLLLLHFLRFIDPGIVAETDQDALGSLFIIIFPAIIAIFAIRLVRRKKFLITVGTGFALLDVILISLLPLLWYHSVSAPDGSPVFLMKNEIFIIAAVFVVINSLTLRPLYPAIFTAGMVILHLVLMFIVLTDPRVTVASTYVQHFFTAAVNPGVFIVRIIIMILMGAGLSFLTWMARQTIQDAVRLEVSNFEIKERQNQLIFEGKMTAITSLVAGVAHEINTPLGVLSSSLDTSEKSVRKFIGANPQESKKGSNSNGLLQVIVDNGKVARTAVQRISKLLLSLRQFSLLDEAETQLANINNNLDTTLSLIKPELVGKVEIIKNYTDIPEIKCKPGELNQVFMTLFVNAFEAMGGIGRLKISSSHSNNQLKIAISDSGPGIPEVMRASLFDIGFSQKEGRVSMGLGLPTAKRIIKQHGGEISVHSASGDGTSFLISLPVQT